MTNNNNITKIFVKILYCKIYFTILNTIKFLKIYKQYGYKII